MLSETALQCDEQVPRGHPGKFSSVFGKNCCLCILVQLVLFWLEIVPAEITCLVSFEFSVQVPRETKSVLSLKQASNSHILLHVVLLVQLSSA